MRIGVLLVSSAASATAFAVSEPLTSWTRRLDVPILALSSAGVPSATIRPQSITMIRPASTSTSSRYWVVNRMVDPSAAKSRMVFHIWPRVRGSSPVVGSSRKIRAGLVIRLAARSRRRRMPPENCEMGRCAASVRSNCASRSSPVLCAFFEDSPCRRPNSQRFSRAVRFSSTDAY